MMINLNKLDFASLGSQDMLTVEQAQALEANRAALEANKAKAIILMTHHMDDSLQYEYMKKIPEGCGSHFKKDLATFVTPCFLT